MPKQLACRGGRPHTCGPPPLRELDPHALGPIFPSARRQRLRGFERYDGDVYQFKYALTQSVNSAASAHDRPFWATMEMPSVRRKRHRAISLEQHAAPLDHAGRAMFAKRAFTPFAILRVHHRAYTPPKSFLAGAMPHSGGRSR